MKKSVFILLGFVIGILFGALASMPFNHWYTTNFVRADEDSNFLVITLVFFFLPIFSISGALAGWRIHKNLTAANSEKK
jgi:CDP-diglyceride synthetase